ncbi:MAG: type II toxin-antitoxin system VapC family toxin [Rhizobiales bacterium]|mgnify:FL=1|nr:type II toxin-antitoxin system VapC family toxin [Hyphomicrobiales bacterium]OJU38011.1 MAG: hypothetical protein BGN94_10075 [Rhizobiales bacterium 68-8]
MNGYLVDTHILLWSLDGDYRLQPHHRKAIESGQPLWVSMATLWEIAIKRSLGKLRAPGDLPEKLHMTGYRLLDITTRHIAALEALPHHHRDPFDRMLIAQARAEDLIIVTLDDQFARYAVQLS